MRSVRAEAARQGRALHLRFVLCGEISRVVVPPPRTPRPADRLWQHTCCEAFLARDAGEAYQEINLSPSGEWAAYAFRAYREGAACPLADPGIVVRRQAGTLELEARVELPAAPLRIGLSAVIEEAPDLFAYWALRHAPGRPDFHHRDAFALELA